MPANYCLIVPGEAMPEWTVFLEPEILSVERQIQELCKGLLGAREPLERVRVLFNREPCDMFVSEIGHMRTSWREPLPRNEYATRIYRTASLRRDPEQDPERLPWIAGPALLFDRQVWF